MKISVTRKRSKIKIYFNDALHIAGDIYAIHSWKFEVERLYYIEYIFKNGSTIADYDNEKHWLDLLSQLDKVI